MVFNDDHYLRFRFAHLICNASVGGVSSVWPEGG